MSAVSLSLIVAAAIFAGGLAGLGLQRVLPARHLSKETLDVIRLGTGMLSVLASLVLGLLIATAKSTYDATEHAIQTYAADLILLDETLRDYGPGAATIRDRLRSYTARVLDDVWSSRRDHTSLENRDAGLLLEHARDDIRALAPVDAGQRWLQGEALRLGTSLLSQRWLLIEQSGPGVRGTVVAILVGWIVLIFVSFGLNAPRNATVVGALLVCALAIGTANFLVHEMDTPFEGLLKISSRPMRSALQHMQ